MKNTLGCVQRYCGLPVSDDTELVSNVISRLRRDKAADTLGLSA